MLGLGVVVRCAKSADVDALALICTGVATGPQLAVGLGPFYSCYVKIPSLLDYSEDRFTIT